MKKNIACLLSILLLSFIFSACRSNERNWGSFSSERTESYDQKYYAEQTVADAKVIVTIYNNETAAEVFSFSPARSSDFWGICWESNSYNIWIQSGDVGVLCYEFDNEVWTINESAKRPSDIISKYDN